MFIYFGQGPGLAQPFQKGIVNLFLLSLSLDFMYKAGLTPWSVIISYHKTITKLLLLLYMQVSYICADSSVRCNQNVHYLLLQTVSAVPVVAVVTFCPKLAGEVV